MATVTGWGAPSEGGSGSDRLRDVDVPIVSDASCQSSCGSSASSEVCAGYPQGGKDSCQGDSGGSLPPTTF
jgi:secreted trypsin-like serine protease